MNKKLRMTIIIIAILFIGVIGLCILLSNMDWTKIIGDFLNRIWGKADSVLSKIYEKG